MKNLLFKLINDHFRYIYLRKETSSIQQMYLEFQPYRGSNIFKDVGDKGLR